VKVHQENANAGLQDAFNEAAKQSINQNPVKHEYSQMNLDHS
jgi:hypothetical protein